MGHRQGEKAGWRSAVARLYFSHQEKADPSRRLRRRVGFTREDDDGVQTGRCQQAVDPLLPALAAGYGHLKYRPLHWQPVPVDRGIAVDVEKLEQALSRR